ncbi:hypothetical protein [Tateyamaria sp. SN3-11]|uniref:hypothetical protein n=1 Tax=Tateyamaria sp. SN3-11 TaxID=3092147 RepID=UPI0039E91FDF
MNAQPAYDVILTHGGNIVRLIPSLRAAVILEQRDGGFVAVLSDLSNFKLGTVYAIIRASASSTRDAESFIQSLGPVSLRRVQEITLEPLVTLMSRLMSFGDDTDSDTPKKKTNSKPVAWSDLHKDLFKMATGWLHWTPETVWNSTLPDLLLAIEGYFDQLQSTHGTNDDNELSEEQRQANIEAGLDPDFDRAGLASLRGLGSVT